MARAVKYTTISGMRVHAHIHTRNELRRAWNEIDGQGNRSARAGGWAVVEHPCPHEETALAYSALFHQLFAIETCCHWDGATWRAYCGDAGGGGVDLIPRVELIPGVYASGRMFNEELGALFAEDARP